MNIRHLYLKNRESKKKSKDKQDSTQTSKQKRYFQNQIDENSIESIIYYFRIFWSSSQPNLTAEKGKTQTDHATQPVETNEDVQIENTRNPKRSSLLPTTRYILNYDFFKFFT